MENKLKKFEEVSRTVASKQEVIRENIKAGSKPSIEEFHDQIDKAIAYVVGYTPKEKEENLWLSVLPEYRLKVSQDLRKTCANFFAEGLRSSDDISIFNDEEKLRDVVEYLLYQQANIENILKKPEDYTRLSAYNNFEFLNKFLNDDNFLANELDMSIEEVREMFPKSIKDRFATANIRDPIGALKRVKEHVQITLTDDNIAKMLDLPIDEARELFNKGMKNHFAVKNITDPIGALKRVRDYLKVTLTDENIAKELNIPVEEVREMFTQNTKNFLAVGYISDPIKAIRQIKEHFETTLSDENIAKELNMPLEEVKNIFTKSLKTRFATANIIDPIKSLRKVKEHLKTTLSDENIAQELDIPIEEIKEIFTQGMKNHFAVNNIGDPLKALRRVKENIEVALADENIAKELNMSIDEVKEIFTKNRKDHFALSNISEPIKALEKIKEHLEITLTDENIAKELGISIDESKEMFSRSTRIRLAISNITDPLSMVSQVIEQVGTVLTNENIARELNMSIEEVKEMFSKSARIRLAIQHRSDTLKTLRQIKENIKVLLTDENIAKELNMSIDEVRGMFIQSTRNRFAIQNVQDPMKKLEQVKANIETILTNENIAKELNISIKEVEELFTPARKSYFAVINITNPLGALKRVREHLAITLTDENIAKELNMPINKVQKIFSQGIKNRFAINNISDPMDAVRNFSKGL